ncbi:MAG: hypothetical protein WBW01_17260 [Terriglobales bacterium]
MNHLSQLCLRKHFGIPHQFEPENRFVGFLQHDTEFRNEFRAGAGSAGGAVASPYRSARAEELLTQYSSVIGPGQRPEKFNDA